MWRFWSVYLPCMGIAGSVEETRQNFDKMVDRDDVSWIAVIDTWRMGLWKRMGLCKRDFLCSRC